MEFSTTGLCESIYYPKVMQQTGIASNIPTEYTVRMCVFTYMSTGQGKQQSYRSCAVILFPFLKLTNKSLWVGHFVLCALRPIDLVKLHQCPRWVYLTLATRARNLSGELDFPHSWEAAGLGCTRGLFL